MPDGYLASQFFTHGATFVLLTVQCEFNRTGEAPSRDQVTLAAFNLVGGTFDDSELYVLRAYHADGSTPLARALADAGIEVVVAETVLEDWPGSMTIESGDERLQVSTDGPATLDGGSGSDQHYTIVQERDGRLLRWSIALDGYGGHESYLFHATLEGGLYEGACPVAPAPAAPSVCEANTDDYQDFTFTSFSEDA